MPLPRLHAALLYMLAWGAGRLPLRALHWLGGRAGATARRRNWRMAKVAHCNLQLAYPALSVEQRRALLATILRDTWRTALETLRFWTHPATRNLRLIRAVHGGGHVDAALAAGRGLIIAAPHYGNWELLSQYIGSRVPMTVLYLPPDNAGIDAFMRRVRSGGGLTPIAADAHCARALYRRLKAGGVVGILPDQQPRRGDGAFAPFFGRPALTMTLLPRLAASTGASVLYAFAERTGAGADASFEIHFQPVAAALTDPDQVVALTALNAGIEAIARRQPAQYQWTYKRFSLQPDDRANPYWPYCYRKHIPHADATITD